MTPYFETKLGKLYHGDCLEIMPELEPVDLVLTDPPYGTTSCKWDSIIPLELMWEQLKRIIKKNGAIVLFGKEPFSSTLRIGNIKNYKYDLYWDKKIPSGICHAKTMPMSQIEIISIFIDGKSFYNPQMIKRSKPIKSGGNKKSASGATMGFKGEYNKTYDFKFPITILRFDKIRRGALHSTQKPVDLMQYLIKNYSNEEQTVLDFTIGSGTTAVACEQINRKWIGIEIEEECCEIAAKRIEENLTVPERIERSEKGITKKTGLLF